MSGKPSRRLAVLVDGSPLPEEEGRALWGRFSVWMEEHHGDLAGFAASEGYASVHPGVDGDHPVLRASKTASQQAYGPAAAVPQGGSPGRQIPRVKPDQERRKSPDSRRKPAK